MYPLANEMPQQYDQRPFEGRGMNKFTHSVFKVQSIFLDGESSFASGFKYSNQF